MNSLCAICNEDVFDKKNTVVLGEKGSVGVNKASDERGDNIKVKSGDIIHTKCRRLYTNKIQIAMYLKKAQFGAAETVNLPHNLRSAEPSFNFKEHCLFCGVSAKYDGKKKGFGVIPVRTMDFHNSITAICEQRKDEWAAKVQARLLSVHDLHAADSVYHHECSTNFRTGKQTPSIFASEDDMPSKRRCGRPQDVARNDAFLEIIKFLEQNDEEQTTVLDLMDQMKQHLSESGLTDIEPYSGPYMKKRLKEYFGDRIIITDINSKPNVVTFFSTASATLQQFYHKQRNEDPEKEKLRLVEAAAQIIKNDIKSLRTEHETYPEIGSLSSIEEAVALLPESLRIFLTGILTGKKVSLKLASLGQALMQAARPRVLTLPLQFGLGVQMHHHFGSRFLNDTLNRMGFACSYDEVKKFESSAAASCGLDIPNFTQNSFMQFAADNVDHNVRTLDGLNTFHGMGMLATVTPGLQQKRAVPKIKVSEEDIISTGRIQIHFYNARPTMSHIQYRSLPLAHAIDDTVAIDLLQYASVLFKPMRPSWSGVMQAAHTGTHPGKSSTVFLPMINMDPTDLSCIYSTLKFICAQADRFDATPVITFDQPLWFKALTIVQNEPADSEIKGVVLRLGGLHIEMSFLGSMGHLMAGSGLQEVLEVIYADNAVQHILSGKAISRAVRAHLLVDNVLNAMLLSSSSDSQSRSFDSHTEATDDY